MKKTIIILFLATILSQIAYCQEFPVPLNNLYSFNLKQISESEYNAQKKVSEHLRYKPYKIVAGIAEAQKLLNKRIKGVKVEEASFDQLEVTYKDGVKKVLNVIWLGWNKENNNFLAYYPEVGVLILEHEASGEYPVDLNDSANEHAGNPKYHAISPDRQFRINGYCPGGAVDGMNYWLEKWNKSTKKYDFIGYFNDEDAIFDYSKDWFWTSNSKALFRYWGSDARYYEIEVIETSQAQQPRFTEFRTEIEKDSCTWYHKITTVETLKNHCIQLVTSSPDCHIEWVCVQVINKTTGKLVQTIDLTGYDSGGYEWITAGDYNFDSYDDFYLTAGVDKWGTGGYGYYFLYDQKTGTFIDSEELNALGKCEFNDDKTVIQRNVWIDDDGKIKGNVNVYQYIDDKLTLISSEQYIDNEEEIDIDLNDAQDLYRRLNSGQLLPGDLETLNYLQQQYSEDTLVIRKTFNDKNGKNQLDVVVINPCLQLKEFEEAVMYDNWRKYYRIDGWINYITVSLNNKNYSDTLIYYNPGVAMSLIHLLERNITLKTISGRKAVFIPFSYCGTSDDDIQITCIVFYDHQKYLYPINLQGADFQNYKIVDDLNEKFEDLPKELKKELIEHINSQCLNQDY